MRYDTAPDEALLQRLPLPLAQIYRRAHNAKTPMERHPRAFSIWEAGLKLLASVAVVEFAQRGEADPRLAEKLQNLVRPQLGHWWEFVRLLVPVLADQGDEAFRRVRDLLLGRTRDDFPRAAGLDSALRQALRGKGDARATVRFTELFDRLVQYRNKVIGHGSPGQLDDDFSERMARALLAGVAGPLRQRSELALQPPNRRKNARTGPLVCSDRRRDNKSISVPREGNPDGGEAVRRDPQGPDRGRCRHLADAGWPLAGARRRRD